MYLCTAPVRTKHSLSIRMGDNMTVIRRKEIAAINTPLVFPGTNSGAWESLSAFCSKGVHYLIVAGEDGKWISKSMDLRRWQELRPLSEEDLPALEGANGDQRSSNCSIVWDEELALYVKYELVWNKTASCAQIDLAVGRDLKHWQCFERDQATAPERGIVYDGDYYRALPFGEYIRKESLPEGVPVFDIRDYGAIADGATLCTEPFMAAAEAARDAGGGIVLVTGGHYCVGSVWIYDNTTLWITMDSALCASKNLSNYDNALLACIDARNVSIRGGGKIIGNGEYFAYLPLKRPLLNPLEKTKLPPHLFDPMGYPVDTIRYAYRSRIRYAEDKYEEGLCPIERPMYTVWICGCEGVSIENIVIEGALDWTLVLDCSQKVKVRDMVINGNRHVANTDGIDIMGCSQVEIDHCFISCADDGICIKSPRRREHDGIEIKGCQAKMRGTSDIRVRDCTVVSVMNAFKIGTETYFDIENVTLERCKFMLPDIFPGTVSGISIESADGGNVRNIEICDVEMNRVCCPLFICLNKRNKYGFGDDRERRAYGAIEHVKIERVNAQEVEVPGIITGFRDTAEETVMEGRVKDIRIQEFYAVYRDNQEELHPEKTVYENVGDYPENNAFGDVPAYGLYIRHGENVTVGNCHVVPRSMNQRECFVWED